MASSSGQPQGIKNLLIPKEGPVAISFTADFSAATTIQADFSQQTQNQTISYVQSVFIDNSLNAKPVALLCSGTNQTIVAPPNSQGYYPILATNPAQFGLTSVGGVTVGFQFLNIPVVGQVWSATGIAPPTPPSAATPVVASPIGALTDRSTVTVATTSTGLFPANAARKYMIISAPQTQGIWLNWEGGVAAPNAAGCIFLPEGAIYESGIMVVSNAVTYYSAAASLEIMAAEA